MPNAPARYEIDKEGHRQQEPHDSTAPFPGAPDKTARGKGEERMPEEKTVVGTEENLEEVTWLEQGETRVSQVGNRTRQIAPVECFPSQALRDPANQRCPAGCSPSKQTPPKRRAFASFEEPNAFDEFRRNRHEKQDGVLIPRHREQGAHHSDNGEPGEGWIPACGEIESEKSGAEEKRRSMGHSRVKIHIERKR